MVLHGERISQPTYAVLRTLPEGSSGEVRVVWHDVFKREMVQKTINTLGLEDSLAHQEPQLLDRIDHDRIVRIREAQPDPDVSHAVTLVMEYLPEGSVGKALEAAERFGIRDAIRVATDILDALDHIHVVHGYLHRDVKPGNVLLEKAGSRGMLTDLGSAAQLSIDSTCDANGGTLLYRAPEYRFGRLDVRSDVYGVGVMLLEMLGGPLPYAMDPQVAERRIAQGHRAFPARLVAFPPHVPPGIARAVRALVARDATRRPSTAGEAATRLRAVKTLDWVHLEGDGPDGAWQGDALPQRLGGAIRSYRVTSRVLAGGANRGARRVDLYYRTAEGMAWRRLATPVTIAAGDVDGMRSVFAEAHSRAFQR